MKNNLKILISSTLVALTFSMPKTQGMEDPYELIEKVYNSSVSYNSGSFTAHQKGLKTFVTSGNSTPKPHNQSVLAYRGNPMQFQQEETVLKKVIPGVDGRMRILDTNRWPHTAFTQITMFFKGDEYGGSGSFVGPHHVLTCGHNVYSRKFNQWADNITVYPALNGGSAPFGKSTVAKVYTFRGWVTSGNQEFDMALLILDSSIGEHTGWCGLLSTLDDTTLYKQEVHITGYPGDKELNQMWTMCHKISIAGPEQFDYEIDTHPGQSGSPIWIDEWGTPMILGVHTLGGNDKNSGVRLSQQKFTRLLINKISQTYVLNPQVLLIPPVAYGYEQIYQRFLNGRLIYKPNKGNDIGKIELRIADLTNPLEGTFNLSQCGDAGKYLSISTGYRKGMKPENANKVEIWFVPRFLVEREINEGASHFKPIFLDKWPNTALIGISWTWGGGHDNEWYDYLTDQTMDALPTRNLYKNWKKSRTCISSSLARCLRALLAEGQCHSNFHVTFA